MSTPLEAEAPPRQVESIPTVTTPVVIPEAQPVMTRGRFLANVIVGAVLALLAIGLLIVAGVVS